MNAKHERARFAVPRAVQPLPRIVGAVGVDPLQESLWFGEEDPGPLETAAAKSRAVAVADAAGLRPFPAVAHEVMQLLSYPDTSVKAVKEVLERDPALASALVRVANSAAYRTVVPCASIEQAIMRLGTRQVWGILASVAALGFFPEGGAVGRRMRDHAIGVAAILRVLSTRWRHLGAHDMFLCGMMHDIGKLLMLQVGEFDYAELPESLRCTPESVHLRERAAVVYDHAILGAVVLERWRFPREIVDVAEWHHQPGRAYALDGALGLKVALLRLADRIEYQLHDTRALDPEFISQLARCGACSYADFIVDDLVELWPECAVAYDDLRAVMGR